MQKTVIAVLAAAAALSVSACNRTDNNTPRTAGTPAAESTNRPANPPANTTPQPGATNPDRARGARHRNRRCAERNRGYGQHDRFDGHHAALMRLT